MIRTVSPGRAIGRLALALCLATGATAAFADPPTGSRLGKHTRPGPSLTERDQATGAKQLAKCMYNRKTSLARQVLLAPTAQHEENASNALLGEIQCFNSVFANDMVEERHVNIPGDILRGMLAEAALGKAHSDVQALEALPLQQVYQRNWFAVTGRHISVDEMGACIADTNPAGVWTLIGTDPMSKAEGTAFGGLSENLGKCLRAGTKLQASRQALRAALADALFQRLYAPTPAPAPAVEAAKK